jgi:transcriptional regulator with XRE-family HTH domain
MKKIFPENMKLLLKQHKLSKLKVSQRAGIPYTSFSEMISGTYLPNADVQRRLAEVFKIDLQEIQRWVAQDKINKGIPELASLLEQAPYHLEKKQRLLVLQEASASEVSAEVVIAQYLALFPSEDHAAITKVITSLPHLQASELERINQALQQIFPLGD